MIWKGIVLMSGMWPKPKHDACMIFNKIGPFSLIFRVQMVLAFLNPILDNTTEELLLLQ